jgi:hypothetical protein
MNVVKVMALITWLWLIAPQWVFGQAFGEYGRTLGGVTGGSRPKAPGGLPYGSSGKGSSQGVGDIGGRSFPSRLVVASQEAGLYPRQDDKTEEIDRLTKGESLVPMIQSEGGKEWYMVKTPKGLIGWVKSTDVREQTERKP